MYECVRPSYSQIIATFYVYIAVYPLICLSAHFGLLLFMVPKPSSHHILRETYTYAPISWRAMVVVAIWQACEPLSHSNTFPAIENFGILVNTRLYLRTNIRPYPYVLEGNVGGKDAFNEVTYWFFSSIEESYDFSVNQLLKSLS